MPLPHQNQFSEKEKKTSVKDSFKALKPSRGFLGDIPQQPKTIF